MSQTKPGVVCRIAAPGVAFASGVKGRIDAVVVQYFVSADSTSFEALRLLAGLLEESPKAFKSTRAMLLKRGDLFSPGIGFSAGRVRENPNLLTFTVSVAMIQDGFIHPFFSLEKKAIRLAKTILEKGPKTDPVSLTLAKGKMIRENADAKNDPLGKAIRGLGANFLPDLILGELPAGDDEKTKSLTEADVLKAAKAVKAAPTLISAAGPKWLWKAARSAFFTKPYGGQLKAVPVREQPISDLSMESGNASAVAVAYRAPSLEGKGLKGQVAGELLSTCLSGPDSLLFDGLREKGGFTYSPGFRLVDRGNVALVAFTTDALKANRAVKATDALMGKAAEGITQAQLDGAKALALTGLANAAHVGLVLAYRNLALLKKGFPLDLEGEKAAIMSIRLDDVKALADYRKIGSFSVIGSFKGE